MAGDPMTALPPYKPGSPAWQAGYEHAKRQMAERLREGAGFHSAIPHSVLSKWVASLFVAEADLVLAMRPSPPRHSPGCAPTTLHQRVAAQDSGGGGNALCGDPWAMRGWRDE